MEVKIQGKIIFENEEYTTQDLNQYVDSIVHNLKKITLGAEEAVALYMKRSPLIIASMFALLKARIPFMPLDSSQPKKRLQAMLETAQIKQVLTDFDTCELENVNVTQISEIQEEDDSYLESCKNETAYILCTSGTTGKPKAVAVSRKGLENFIMAIPERIPLEQVSCIACFTNFTFDISLLESVLALYHGLTVVLANEVEMNHPQKMVDLIGRHQVDMLQATPSRIKMIQLIDPKMTSFRNIKNLLVGGEVFEKDLLHELKEFTNARIFNMYGPTETTIWSTISELTKKESVDIGTPIKNTTIYLLDKIQQEAKDGEVGEICIGGDGLALGYIQNEEQTKKHFSYLSFGTKERIYRTGDLGKYKETGELIYLGREDSQIKLYGHRIELEDIEANMNLLPWIKQSVVCFDKEKQLLYAFYIAKEKHASEEIRRSLDKDLPEYMIPFSFMEVERFIYTMSGKLDRNAMLLAYQETCRQEEASFKDTKKSSVYVKMQDLLRDILESPGLMIVPEKKLSDYGINSVTLVRIIVEFEDEYDFEFEDEMVIGKSFENLGALIAYIEENVEGLC